MSADQNVSRVARAIRCDRNIPCANCQLAGTPCGTSKRAPRQKQARVLISSQYENKIDRIESKLERLIDVVETLSLEKTSHRTPTDRVSKPSPDVPMRDSPGKESPDDSPDEPQDSSVQEVAKGDAVVEGQSALSAHSSFAMNFMQNAVGANNGANQNGEIGGLLETLRHIVEVSNDQRASSRPLLPLARKTPIRYGNSNMPPLEKIVFVLQKARDEKHPTLSLIEMLFAPSSLTDLCLKVYFSHDCSDYDYAIVNTALHAITCETVLARKISDAHDDMFDEYSKYVSMYAANIETALAGLPLCAKASHNLVLGLLLGAIYCVDTSKPALAWNLVTTASQHARALGYHTRAVGTEHSTNALNHKGITFWAIYTMEKFLCLRLGRSSSLQDNDITVPLPKTTQSDTPATDSFNHTIRLACLAGRVYEQLYCTNALSLPIETRQARVGKLSRELHGIIQAARATNDAWLRNATIKADRETAIFCSMSDDVLRLSMLTLIHRAMPRNDLKASFSQECITSARYALERHEVLVRDLGLKDSVLLATYINWSILFIPFVPYIALFCHVIETGDLEDLNRMKTFVASLESACADSRAIAKQHSLFQVFYSVALRYTQLRGASPPSQEESARLRMEMDTQLNALGLQIQAGAATGQGVSVSDGANAMMVWPDAAGIDALDQFPAAGVDLWEEQSLRLGNWFSFSQNMMGLVEQNEWPL
ncbi:hypothetical protein N7492_008365 [Penicillium capsulatum]|uniref:Xylanolytic transcriptional activator regulatory domain-containing protein n=1 Tax=Penicillium capsulatum TaxID=69766 RepID=A0A9W9LH05_9EURO|nr:hypothetical protein N7492_008365 [Penicillium capsulatum]KAJ6105767.1 hypothetical protein N7512_009284 [Penicillium capsulatum]